MQYCMVHWQTTKEKWRRRNDERQMTNVKYKSQITANEKREARMTASGQQQTENASVPLGHVKIHAQTTNTVIMFYSGDNHHCPHKGPWHQAVSLGVQICNTDTYLSSWCRSICAAVSLQTWSHLQLSSMFVSLDASVAFYPWTKRKCLALLPGKPCIWILLLLAEVPACPAE